MKKVGIITATLGKGGAEKVSINIARYFIKNGYECDILTIRRLNDEYIIPNNINRICACEKKENLITTIMKLRKIIKNSNFDIFIIMGVPLCTYVVPALIGFKIPFIVSERSSPSHFVGNRINTYISRLFMKKAKGYIFQTEGAKNFYKKSLQDRGIVIHNPLVVSELPQRYTEKRKKIIVSVGRLIPSKNHKLLINAFNEIIKIFPDYELNIYGEGYFRNELDSQIELLELKDKVHLMGNFSNIAEEIKDKALFVMTSDYEGMPNALIEAMSIGMPCISTDCPDGGASELIHNGTNGILVPVGNLDKMVFAMKQIICDEELAKKCGENAYYIREDLDINIIGKKWIEYIEKCCIDTT